MGSRNQGVYPTTSVIYKRIEIWGSSLWEVLFVAITVDSISATAFFHGVLQRHRCPSQTVTG